MPATVLRTIALALLGAAIVVAPARAEPLKVAKPAAIGFGFSMLDVGIEAGIFKKHGVEVQSVVLAGSAKQQQALVANAIDISMGAGTDLAFLVKGAPEKGVAALAGPPLNFVAMTSNDGKINSLADLKGKRISASTVGSITYWFASQISVKQHWSGADALTIVPLGDFDAMRAALVTGNIDAISATLEGALVLEKAGQGKLLVKFGDLIHPFLTHVAFASDTLIAQHPDALRRFLAGWFDTVIWSKAHKDEMLRYSMEATKLPADISSKAYDAEMPMFFDNGHFDPQDLKAVEEALIETHQLDKLPDTSKIITEEFLK
ncbi:MAG TPA: ABC transporter substrate-binding protein [Stellaceae bacterium]|jgi:NitT/TauT family transport system substrate-binding protein